MRRECARRGEVLCGRGLPRLRDAARGSFEAWARSGPMGAPSSHRSAPYGRGVPCSPTGAPDSDTRGIASRWGDEAHDNGRTNR